MPLSLSTFACSLLCHLVPACCRREDSAFPLLESLQMSVLRQQTLHTPQVWNAAFGIIYTTWSSCPRGILTDNSGESLQIIVSARDTLSLFLFRLHLLCLKNLGVVHSLLSRRGCRHPSLKIYSRKASKGRKTSLAFLFPACTDGIWERLVYFASGCSAYHFFDSLQQICSHKKIFEIGLQPESAKVSPRWLFLSI